MSPVGSTGRENAGRDRAMLLAAELTRRSPQLGWLAGTGMVGAGVVPSPHSNARCPDFPGGHPWRPSPPPGREPWHRAEPVDTCGEYQGLLQEPERTSITPMGSVAVALPACSPTTLQQLLSKGRRRPIVQRPVQ